MNFQKFLVWAYENFHIYEKFFICICHMPPPHRDISIKILQYIMIYDPFAKHTEMSLYPLLKFLHIYYNIHIWKI